jgi:hypothetical protein
MPAKKIPPFSNKEKVYTRLSFLKGKQTLSEIKKSLLLSPEETKKALYWLCEQGYVDMYLDPAGEEAAWEVRKEN